MQLLDNSKLTCKLISIRNFSLAANFALKKAEQYKFYYIRSRNEPP